MTGRQRQAMSLLVLSLLVALGIGALGSGNQDGQRIGTDAGIFARARLVTVVEAPPVADASTTTSSAVAAAPTATTTTTTPRPPVAARAPVTTSTTAPAPPTAAAETTTTTTTVATTTSTTAAPSTTTTVDPCRNSTDYRCGPFRFDPQPGANRPMTVEVTVEPAAAVAGQPVVFHITLTDPDGVSYDGTNFNFGNSGIGGSTPERCAKFGRWDPPPPAPASATETIAVTHTYFEAGSYTATFFFDAGPFDCVDTVSGRGDRPYASSATGTVTVVVGPAA